MIKKKQALAFLVCIILLVINYVPIYAETLPVIAVGNVTAEKGGNISVPINLSGNTGICGATISVSYNENLTLTGIDKGDALSRLTMTRPGNLSANPIKIVWDGTDADNSNGVIAFLNFDLPNEEGLFNINISYDDGDIVNGMLSPIEISLQNGSVTIGNGNEGQTGNNTNPNNIVLSADVVNSDLGGSIDVPIRISGNTGICGATVSISYDNAMSLTKITKGEALSLLTMTKPGNLSPNPFNLVWDGMEADSSNGIIAILTFSVPSGYKKYNIELSYLDGDIVDENLLPVNPTINSGYIQIGSSFEATVMVAGQSVKLEGQSGNGKIIVAFYEENGKMLSLNIYDVASVVNAGSVNNATKAKVMWWDNMSGMKPICPAQTVSLTQQ